MTVLEQDRRTTGNYLIREANGFRSRDEGILIAGSGEQKAGRVCTINNDGKYVPFSGKGNAVAILYQSATANEEDVRVTFSTRDCEVVAEALIFAENTTEKQKSTAIQSLATRGIIAR